MSGPNTSYSAIARLLHWLIALLILTQFIGGWLMTHKGVPESFLFSSFQLHKSFGFVILFLSVVRLIWRLTHKTPALPDGMKAWEISVSKITHTAFYVLMIAIPLTGWIMISASTADIPTKLFFTLPIPHLPVPVSAELSERFSGFHEFLAFAMIGLFLLHVGAAAKHHVISRDTILTRMAGKGTFAPLLALGFAGLMALAIAASMLLFQGEEESEASAPTAAIQAQSPSISETPAASMGAHSWTLIAEETYLTIDVFAKGDIRKARFSDIRGEITLDPDAPDEAGRVNVLIGTDSLTSDEPMAVSQAKEAAWLNTESFPEARFVSETISKNADGSYTANGELTLKDVTAPLSLPFTLLIDGSRATAHATAVFDRSIYGLGPSETENFEVSVSVTVHAHKAAS